MDLKNIDKDLLETIIRQVIEEKLNLDKYENFIKENKGGVISVKLDTVKVSEEDRLDIGNSSDIVYTKDVLTLDQSKRLGAGIMEMKQTTFDWTLDYDEIDYVIEGHLDIIINGEKVSANKDEIIFIPKGSKIKFSVPEYARFLYITYPADWNSQK